MGMLQEQDQKIQQPAVSESVDSGYNEERAGANPEYQGASQPDVAAPPDTTEQMAPQDAAAAGAEGDEMAAGGDAATPEEQAEYERVMNQLGQILYGKENVARSVLKMINPEMKIDGAVKASLMLISKLDEMTQMADVVVPQVTGDTVSMVIDMAQEGKGVTFDEREAQQAAAATWEGVMEMFGVDEEDYMGLASGMSKEEAAGHQQYYQELLNG